MISLRASTGVAVAIVGVAVVPALVGEVTAPLPAPAVAEGSAAAEQPKAAEAELTITLTGEERLPGSEVRLRIMAKGPSESGTSTLSDASGLHPVQVETVDSGVCDTLTARQALSVEADTEWCLTLSGLDDGRQVQGAIAATGTNLKLNVSRRGRYFPGWPFLAGFVGLLIGAAAILIPQWLRNKVRPGLLNEALDRNEDNSTVETTIADLRAFVTNRRQAGDKDDTLLPLISGVIRDGRLQASEARAELTQAIQKSRLPRTHPFIVMAGEEAGRTDHRRRDFLGDDGELVEHPAERDLDALSNLEAQAGEIQALQATIDKLPPASRVDPQVKLNEARDAFNAVIASDQVKEIGAKLQVVRVEIAGKVREPETSQIPSDLAERFDIGFADEAFGSHVAGQGNRLDRSARRSRRPEVLGLEAKSAEGLIRYKILTGIIGATVVAWALFSLHQSVYLPKASFGTFNDYAALITAAIGSGAAAAVVGLVALWNPFRPTEES